MLIRRNIATIAYQLHRTVRYTLRIRPDLLKMLLFQFRYIGTPEANSMQPDEPWGCIRRIKITTPRGEVLKDFVPLHMEFLNSYEYGTRFHSTFQSNYAPSTVFDLVSDLFVPFDNHTAKYWPEETILNTNEASEIWIDITWGDTQTDLFSSPGTPGPEVTLAIIPLERQPVNMSDQLEPRKKMIDLSEVRPFINDLEEIEYLLPENTLIKTILVVTSYKRSQAGWKGTRVNTLVRLKVVDDDNANIWVNKTGEEIQSENKQYYGIESDYVGAPPVTYDQQSGIYVIEFDVERDLTSCYNTAGKNYPKLILELEKEVAEDLEIGIFIRQISTPPALQIVPPPESQLTRGTSPRIQPIRTPVPVAPISPTVAFD